ncbi:MAG: hypothetical protein KAR84_05410, partial [Elusimicrobiales bacterium]|nr:hypothetical protein [Elusimicrobiales bacterium]
SGKEKLSEQIILGLRTAQGIVLNDDIFIKFKDNIESLLKLGLIEVTPPPLLLRSALWRSKFAKQINSAKMPNRKKRGGGIKTGRLKIKPEHFYISNRIFSEFV